MFFAMKENITQCGSLVCFWTLEVNSTEKQSMLSGFESTDIDPSSQQDQFIASSAFFLGFRNYIIY